MIRRIGFRETAMHWLNKMLAYITALWSADKMMHLSALCIRGKAIHVYFQPVSAVSLHDNSYCRVIWTSRHGEPLLIWQLERMERAWTFSLCFCVVCILISRSSLAIATVATNGSVVLEIEQGKLRGFEETSRNRQSYFAFLGIPFVDKPERFEVKPLSNFVRETMTFLLTCLRCSIACNAIF